MVSHHPPRLIADDVLVIADDLAGAAEAAAALAVGVPSRLQFVPRVGTPPIAAPQEAARPDLVPPASARPETEPPEPGVHGAVPPGTVLVVDTDSRYLPGSAARSVVRAALATRPHARLIMKKVDSLLRGRIADELAELRATGLPIVAAFALPAMRRTVVGGVVHLDGIPLHRTDAWGAEHSEPPESIPVALHGIPTVVLPLPTVRGPALGAQLRAVLDDGAVPLCDAETQDDLRRIADAAIALSAPSRAIGLVGTGDLARAVGQRITGAQVRPHRRDGQRSPVLVVAGTLASGITDQIAALHDAGAVALAVRAPDLAGADTLAALGGRVAAALAAAELVVVHLDRASDWHRDAVAALAAALVAGTDLSRVDLVLTGGETARRVLDALGVVSLDPHGELAHGVVLSHRAADARVVTRPGSFGDAHSLVDIVAYLRPDLIERPPNERITA
ncbi:four-carbon acid sugar kinase family protein [Lacisediminihabitans profunda]|uniref:4-hydroxythreonine-4-phosphate dehydrogenase n=1 Tax=Lacisediminihabitans profunda TaxID=2594790 RepID=A0A5C8UP30_9MICO|nr:four-carbon acid sugar kinase family protein [Lacisediminihabitans profunda]TXN29993.1 4-hydroxythreonine-4-phosphate dehydrogenase [Lacisediminihabitans profunda]